MHLLLGGNILFLYFNLKVGVLSGPRIEYVKCTDLQPAVSECSTRSRCSAGHRPTTRSASTAPHARSASQLSRYSSVFIAIRASLASELFNVYI